jgi:hypothetical protein
LIHLPPIAPAEEHYKIAEALKELHPDVEVTAQDLAYLQMEAWRAGQARELGLARGEIVVVVDAEADIGKALVFIGGALLGAFFLPGLVAGVNWLTGALIVGSIGNRLASLFDGPQKIDQAPTGSTSDPVFAFSGAGGLATINSPIAIVYGNRTNNSFGGVLLRDPPMIYSRIFVKAGAQYLERLSLLGVGQLGSVSTTGLQLDDQTLDNYDVGDVTVQVSPGLHNQSALGGITNYSQSVSLNANTFLGLSPALTTGGTDFNAWTAAAQTTSVVLPATYGGMVVVSAQLTGSTAIDCLFGFNNAYQATPTVTSANLAVRITGTTWAVTGLGTAIASGTRTITAASVIIFRMLRSHPNNVAQLIIDNVEVWRATTTLPTTVFGFNRALVAGTAFAGARYCAYTPVGDMLPGFGSRFALSALGLSKLRSSQLYRSGTVTFSIVAKDSSSPWVETNKPLLLSDRVGVTTAVAGTDFIKDSAEVRTSYRSTVTTSKPVTSIDIVMKASIWSQNVNGEESNHAQAFEISIVTAAGVTHVLGRFILISAKQTPLLRMITITNLPKGIYKIKLEPLASDQITASIRSLEEDSTVSTVPTGISIGGQAISFKAELGGLIPVATAQLHMSFAGKPQHSDQKGPSIQITHLNEMVDPTTPPTYPGYTIGRSLILASDRIQSAPSESWDIPQGQIVRQYLVYGKSFYSDTVGTVNYSASFPEAVLFSTTPIVPGLVQAGDIVEIIGKGFLVATSAGVIYQTINTARSTYTCATTSGSSVVTTTAANITAMFLWTPVSGTGIPAGACVVAKLSATTFLIGDRWGRNISATATGAAVSLVFNARIVKASGDRVVVYRMGSSNYFPDLFIDRLINPVSGLGNYVNANHFIHYDSIVKARAFCVANNLYYDGVFAEGGFEAWAIASAPSSLLFPTMLEGQYALLPQQDEPTSYVYNDSNTSKYVEPGVPWQSQLTNAMLTKYQTNLGREKQVKIGTTALSNGLAKEVAQTISTQGVTAEAQAIKVGQVALKSKILQDRVCQITTDVGNGLYTRQGKIITTQHAAIEYQNERNGFVMTVQAVTNARFVSIGTSAIVAMSNTQIQFADRHPLKVESDGFSSNDRIVISGTLSSNVTVPTIRYSNDYSISLPVGSTIAGQTTALTVVTGTATFQRTQYDQVVTLSEPIVVTANTRVSIVHAQTRNTEEDREIVDIGGGSYRIIGVEEAIGFGDSWILGETVSFNRIWRLTGVKPDISSNKVELFGVLWDPAVLDPAGTVVM